MAGRLLIVDDHPTFRECARRLLETEGCRVVGEACDCASGLEAARTLEPEVVLVDVNLPDADGFELTSRLGTLPRPPAVVLTSSRDGADCRKAAAASGARGFVTKADLSLEAIERLLGAENA